ncbi:helix-turn-helix protein [Neomoorella glycerini]|uniref:Helix-turn-helix protein n=1 Tax=Neomoorella glycerini TaxID=55779 RepID=A0A6I5ZU25_9FIRM|nr:helix-turn-helix transcriptional regulator [Moorella glycerini]QGP93430.1 helix-turn-helix protein [Moorella glycerini]
MNRIRELREAKGISGTKLAEMLGISPQHLYDLEKGKRRLNETFINRLTEIFNVTSDYLLGKDIIVNKQKKYENDEATRLFARLSGLTPEGREKVLRELEWIEELERKRFLERKKKQNQEKN